MGKRRRGGCQFLLQYTALHPPTHRGSWLRPIPPIPPSSSCPQPRTKTHTGSGSSELTGSWHPLQHTAELRRKLLRPLQTHLHGPGTQGRVGRTGDPPGCESPGPCKALHSAGHLHAALWLGEAVPATRPWDSHLCHWPRSLLTSVLLASMGSAQSCLVASISLYSNDKAIRLN